MYVCACMHIGSATFGLKAALRIWSHLLCSKVEFLNKRTCHLSFSSPSLSCKQVAKTASIHARTHIMSCSTSNLASTAVMPISFPCEQTRLESPVAFYTLVHENAQVCMRTGQQERYAWSKGRQRGDISRAAWRAHTCHHGVLESLNHVILSLQRFHNSLESIRPLPLR